MNLTRGGTVTDDSSGVVVLRMDVPLFLRLFGRFVLVDVAGRPLVTVQRKASTVTIPSLLIQVYLGLGIDRRCCCEQAFSLYREWEAFRGDGHGHNGGELHACMQIRRRRTAAGVVLGKSTFSVTVFPNVDDVFIAALAVMLNEIHVARRRNT
jgi:uncharacterized protein YxjI